MRRTVENVLTCSHLDDASRIHDTDTVCHIGNHPQVMCDKNDGEIPLPLHLVNQLQDSCLNRHIQSRCRLVTDQNLRVARKRDGDDDTLAHTSGELKRIRFIPLSCIWNADSLHELNRPSLGL